MHAIFRFDVAALNFRGCSGELSKYPVGYHLGFTDDLLHVVRKKLQIVDTSSMIIASIITWYEAQRMTYSFC